MVQKMLKNYLMYRRLLVKEFTILASGKCCMPVGAELPGEAWFLL